MAKIGAHVSVAGGMPKAFPRAKALGCEAIQVFVKNANRWQGKVLSDEEVAAFRAAHAEAGIPVIAHASYLINLASPDDALFAKSAAALADELDRCTRLGVSGLVLHPGAHVGAGVEAGIRRVAEGLDSVFEQHPSLEASVLLENTAGQGTTLGADLHDLASILAQVAEPERFGVCIDACHAFAAGYDLRTQEGYDRLFADIEAILGLPRLRALHLNDSRFPMASHRDRHANIGEGEIGTPFFARVLADARLDDLPAILETPEGEDDEGYRRDLATLRGLR